MKLTKTFKYNTPNKLEVVVRGDLNNDYRVYDKNGTALSGWKPAIENLPALLEACKALVWKLNHSTSKSGKGNDCVPATVSRQDITIKLIQQALNEIGA